MHSLCVLELESEISPLKNCFNYDSVTKNWCIKESYFYEVSILGKTPLGRKLQPPDLCGLKIIKSWIFHFSKQKRSTTGQAIWFMLSIVLFFFKHINRESHWYTRKVKEAIHTRLSPNNINRDNGAEIQVAWMPTIKKHRNQRRTKNQRTPEEAMVHGNNSRIEMHQLQQTTMIYKAAPEVVDLIAWRRLAVSSRNVAFHI